MLKWLLLFPVNIFMSLVCYLTNPMVVLFADERGELHGVWRYWQTWDDSLDVEWFVKETVPRFFRYDFSKHYVSDREQTVELAQVNRDKGCVICIDDNFTCKERLQRYICRVLWLTRNCGYGFAFWLFGCNHCGTDLIRIKTINCELIYKDWQWDAPWRFIADWRGLQVMAGWKLHESSTKETRSMIAGRIIYRRR